MSGSYLTVDLSAMRANLRAIQAHVSSPILVVVKANAYGHGIVPVGKLCEEFGVEFLGVVHIEEVRVLRQSGIRSKILVMGVIPCNEYEEAHANGAEIAVWRPDQLEAASQIGLKSGRDFRVHLKIDTGMGRFGVLPTDLPELVDLIAARPGITVAGVYSHLASADEPNQDYTWRQLQVFRECLALLSNRGINPAHIHIANSPASLKLKESIFTMARIGVAGYGLKPDINDLLPGMCPIATWTSTLLNVKKIPANHSVGYGGQFITGEEMPVGVIAIGYADGFRRYPKEVNSVLIHGQAVRTIGRICMDYSMVDLRGAPNAHVGDEVILMGNGMPAEELATRWGTNNYDVVVNIGNRVARRYI